MAPNFLVHTGISEPEGNGLKLKAYQGAPAVFLSGGEEGSQYEAFAKIKVIDANSASLIAGWTQDEDYNESYVEFCLDVTNQKLILHLFIQTEDPLPVEALTRPWTLQLNRDYECAIKLHADSEGTIWVFCYLDGVEVFRFEPLGEIFAEGMWGLRVDGADGKSAVFTDLFVGPYGAERFLQSIYTQTGVSKSDLSLQQGWELLEHAMRTAESETGESALFAGLTGDMLLLVQTLTKIYFICHATGGMASGLSYSLGSVSLSTPSGIDIRSMLEQLKNDVENLLEKFGEAGGFRVCSDE